MSFGNYAENFMQLKNPKENDMNNKSWRYYFSVIVYKAITSGCLS